MTAHESFTHSAEFEQSSNTNFGYTFTIVFAVLALWPVVWHGLLPQPWFLMLACCFALVTLWAPQWLKPLNKIWFFISVVLGKIMVPVTMIPIYAIAIIPIGLAMKLFKADPLRLGFEPHIRSYWILRTDEQRTDMTDQF
jgi:hypothetical protein